MFCAFSYHLAIACFFKQSVVRNDPLHNHNFQCFIVHILRFFSQASPFFHDVSLPKSHPSPNPHWHLPAPLRSSSLEPGRCSARSSGAKATDDLSPSQARRGPERWGWDLGRTQRGGGTQRWSSGDGKFARQCLWVGLGPLQGGCVTDATPGPAEGIGPVRVGPRVRSHSA